MSLKVSDLNYDSKRQILDLIQNQIGATEYKRIINSIGEDELIRLFILEMEKKNPGVDTVNNVNTLSERNFRIAKNIFLGISIAILITALIFGVILKENWYGKVLLGIGGLPISVWLLKYFNFSFDEIYSLSLIVTCIIFTVIAFFCGFYQLFADLKIWWPAFLDNILDTWWIIIMVALFIIFIIVWISKAIMDNMPRF